MTSRCAQLHFKIILTGHNNMVIRMENTRREILL